MWHLYNLIREVKPSSYPSSFPTPGFRVRARVTMYAPRQYGMDFRNDNPSQLATVLTLIFQKPCAERIRNRVLRIAPRAHNADASSDPNRVHPTNHSNNRSWRSGVVCARRTDGISADYGTRRGGERACQDGRVSHA
jgi:hypothetical protein